MASDLATERKNEIILATIQCIKEKGYYHFSMQDVAKLSGVSKGIIHYYFLNKDHLMLNVLETLCLNIFPKLDDSLQENKDPLKIFEALMKTCLNLTYQTKEYYEIQIDFWSRVYQKTSIEDIVQEHFKKFHKIFTKSLNQAVKKKVIKEINTDHYASICLALLDGLSLQKFFIEKSIDYNKVVDEAIHLILERIKK